MFSFISKALSQLGDLVLVPREIRSALADLENPKVPVITDELFRPIRLDTGLPKPRTSWGVFFPDRSLLVQVRPTEDSNPESPDQQLSVYRIAPSYSIPRNRILRDPNESLVFKTSRDIATQFRNQIKARILSETAQRESN